MADIQKELNDIKNAVYGKEVRGAIHDGIKKINEEVEDTTELSENAKHQVENIQQQVNQLVVEGDSSVEAAQARVDAEGNVYTTLKERLDAEQIKLAHTSFNLSTSIGKFDWWKPPVQPSYNNKDTNYDGPNTGAFPLNQTDYPYDWIIERAWDWFINDSSLEGYVTKTVLGKDQSGTYDIYRYEFTPQNYEKTIILSAAMHGWENIGTAVLSRIMHHICYDWENSPQLAYLRHKVRFIILPFVNPWGYSNQSVNNGRTNSNGVDINRNFDYAWNDYVVLDPSYDNKGSAPHSELETQYVVNTLNQFSDAIAYLDFHNMVKTPTTGDFVIYEPIATGRTKIADIIAYKFRENEVRITGSANPMGCNYATKLNMYGLTPEFVKGAFNPQLPCDSIEMTKWVEYAGNLILLVSQLTKPSYQLNAEPFVYLISRDWSPGLLQVTSSEDQEVNVPTFEFDIPTDGIVKVDYDIVFKNTEVGAFNYFIPLLGQKSNPWYKPSTVQARWKLHKSTVVADARDTIHLTASIPVIRTVSSEKCRVGLYASVTAGIMDILRVRMNISFIPSNSGIRHRTLAWHDNSQIYYDSPGFKYYRY